MKLFILRPKSTNDKSPWSPWYDKCFGMVVQAKDARQARLIASKDGMADAWLKAKWSSCVALVPKGKPEIIIKDEHWA